MSDQMREEFEAAYLAKYDLKPQNWNGVAYLHAHGNGAWWAWKASRAALVVELPKLSKVEGCHGVEFRYTATTPKHNAAVIWS